MAVFRLPADNQDRIVTGNGAHNLRPINIVDQRGYRVGCPRETFHDHEVAGGVDMHKIVHQHTLQLLGRIVTLICRKGIFISAVVHRDLNK
ncbi:hypothetical protein D3C87_1758750 [compost metagenome]